MNRIELICRYCGVCSKWSTLPGTVAEEFAATVRCPECGIFLAQPKPRFSVKDPRKQSVYLTDAIAAEIAAEADRLDRSISWVVQRAVRKALPHLRTLPAVNAGLPVASAEAEASP